MPKVCRTLELQGVGPIASLMMLTENMFEKDAGMRKNP